jgi:hypothetical protein
MLINRNSGKNHTRLKRIWAWRPSQCDSFPAQEQSTNWHEDKSWEGSAKKWQVFRVYEANRATPTRVMDKPLFFPSGSGIGFWHFGLDHANPRDTMRPSCERVEPQRPIHTPNQGING